MTRYQLHRGDSRELLKTLADNSVDSIVTDPPYELGFMGKGWDRTGIANDVTLWTEALRVLKPGAHLVAFSGTRTYHRMVCAIEDAGFDVRDQLQWIYSSGFPKSHNLDNLRGDRFCACEPTPQRDLRPVPRTDVPASVHPGDERRQVLQPRMPQQGSHAAMLWAEPCEGPAAGAQPGLAGWGDGVQAEGQLQRRPVRSGASVGAPDGKDRRLSDGAPAGDGRVVRLPADQDGGGASPGPRPDEEPANEPGAVAGQPQPQDGGAWPVCGGCGKPMVPEGLGTALKPAHEPIVLARKPLIGTVVANVLAYGTGGLNIQGCRVDGQPRSTHQEGNVRGAPVHGGGTQTGVVEPIADGRWPANIIHDGSDEVLAAFPEAPGQFAPIKFDPDERKTQGVYGAMKRGHRPGGFGNVGAEKGDPVPNGPMYMDGGGSAARFFKCCQMGEEDWQTARNLAQLARSAVSQCASCGTPIAAAVAATRISDSKSAASPATPGCTGSCGSSTQTRSLANAGSQESTDTTPTTASLSKSCGCAQPAIGASTSLARMGAEAADSDQVKGTRFLYCPKASQEDREEGIRIAAHGDGGVNRTTLRRNIHPTVKPTDLMRYLVRLVTPKRGTVLDLFTGSGSTGKAAMLEGLNFIGFELDADENGQPIGYIDIARDRIEFALRQGHQPSLLDAALEA